MHSTELVQHKSAALPIIMPTVKSSVVPVILQVPVNLFTPLKITADKNHAIMAVHTLDQ